MARQHIPAYLRRLIIARAQGRCEYCLLGQDDSPFTHPIDHIIAIRHGGKTIAENAALACFACNHNKAADLSTIDPLTGLITPLFNSRREPWQQHFHLENARIIGVTAIGRATVTLLRINDPMRVIERELLIAVGRYP